VSLPLALLLHPWEGAPAPRRRPSRRATPLGCQRVVPRHVPSLAALTDLIYQLRAAVLIMLLLLVRASRRAGCLVPPPRITPDPRRATPLCARCTTSSRSTLILETSACDHGRRAFWFRCVLKLPFAVAPRTATWHPGHVRAGYQCCGREHDASVPRAEHTRVLGNGGAPHPSASLPERVPPGVAPRYACYRALLLAALTRAHPGAAPHRAGTPRAGAAPCAMLGLRAVAYSLQVHT
jgi:hypothetical protein